MSYILPSPVPTFVCAQPDANYGPRIDIINHVIAFLVTQFHGAVSLDQRSGTSSTTSSPSPTFLTVPSRTPSSLTVTQMIPDQLPIKYSEQKLRKAVHECLLACEAHKDFAKVSKKANASGSPLLVHLAVTALPVRAHNLLSWEDSMVAVQCPDECCGFDQKVAYALTAVWYRGKWQFPVSVDGVCQKCGTTMFGVSIVGREFENSTSFPSSAGPVVVALELGDEKRVWDGDKIVEVVPRRLAIQRQFFGRNDWVLRVDRDFRILENGRKVWESAFKGREWCCYQEPPAPSVLARLSSLFSRKSAKEESPV